MSLLLFVLYTGSLFVSVSAPSWHFSCTKHAQIIYLPTCLLWSDLAALLKAIPLRSTSDEKYVVPGTRLVFDCWSFTVAGPSIRNSLLPHVCKSLTETIFRSKVKTYLFSSTHGFQ